jgi:hypothetical protein
MHHQSLRSAAFLEKKPREGVAPSGYTYRKNTPAKIALQNLDARLEPLQPAARDRTLFIAAGGIRIFAKCGAIEHSREKML